MTMSRHTRPYSRRAIARIAVIPAGPATRPAPRHIPSALDDFGDTTDHGHHSITGIPVQESRHPAMHPWAVQDTVMAVLRATLGFVSAHDAMAGSVDHLEELDHLISRLSERDTFNLLF